MVLQRDQVTVWERHISNTMLTRLDVSALISGDFGLARAADDLVHTFAGQRPNLSPWESYWAMGLCPDTPRKALYTTVLQMGSIWIGCKGGSAAYLFYDQMLSIWMELVSFCLTVRCKKLFWYLTSLDSLLISTSDCKFLWLSLHSSCSAWWFKTQRVI